MIERCVKCGRERPRVIHDAACAEGGYCRWTEVLLPAHPALHRCTLPKHLRNHPQGTAIEVCYETGEGCLVVTNYKHSNYVAFCPFCGTKAKAVPPEPESG